MGTMDSAPKLYTACSGHGSACAVEISLIAASVVLRSVPWWVLSQIRSLSAIGSLPAASAIPQRESGARPQTVLGAIPQRKPGLPTKHTPYHRGSQASETQANRLEGSKEIHMRRLQDPTYEYPRNYASIGSCNCVATGPTFLCV